MRVIHLIYYFRQVGLQKLFLEENVISAHAAGYWAWLNSRGVSSHNSRPFSQLCGFPDIPQTALPKTARDGDTLFASEARPVRQKGDRQHVLFAAGGPYFRARTTSSSPFASQTLCPGSVKGSPASPLSRQDYP
ncbi:hypothetical protein OIDMADRAFT_30595 [Oidiodendron maius Zn]|uniref:Uncharacterized protein n=1 Tax=Oidiodendron maius (strain Zn) TaxID=913774 RepID=A0A0C3H9A4_OIDMZ|nr:hypothetical protein OIDMADRAFT_30595 [Oidiodendron maius Zn]